MRKMLALTVFAAVLFFGALPAAAAEYEGRLLDGHAFRATVYGSLGAEPGIVYFQRDEARVQLLDGEQLIIVLYNRSFDDMHFVTGKSLDGRFYRLDVQEDVWFYNKSNDAFFMPFGPGFGNQAPVFVHGGMGGSKGRGNGGGGH